MVFETGLFKDVFGKWIVVGFNKHCIWSLEAYMEVQRRTIVFAPFLMGKNTVKTLNHISILDLEQFYESVPPVIERRLR